MNKKQKNFLLNLVFPVFIFGAITGIFTAVIIVLYKYCAKHIIHLSEKGYHFMGEHLYMLAVAIPLFILFAIVLSLVYKKYSDLKGGGIPSSIGILRGLLPLSWPRSIIGTFVLSLGSFLFGVPLGNEGPSVQMGTATGAASLYFAGKKRKAWKRYLMTGGACAGFSAATGAPISGVLFAIEEAHQRISPMIILVSAVSVMFCRLTTEILAPIFKVSVTLFPDLVLVSLVPKEIWLPLVVGVIMGLFAVIFLNYFKLINAFISHTLKKVPTYIKLSAILLLTLFMGIISYDFISTGHETILHLFDGNNAIYMLILILIVRSTLTVSANTSGITGGIFLPTLAIGGVMSAIIAEVLTRYCSVSEQYYSTILVLGITACIAGMMKMPLTAIVFAVEALSCHNNVLYVIVVAAVSFVITEIFFTKSTNDNVLEARVESQNKHREHKVIDTFVTVKAGSFAVGKQIRDILWPSNLFVLSLTHQKEGAEVDEHGGTYLRENDVLHIRYLTYDEETSKSEIHNIVGQQDYDETATEVI